MAESGKAKKGGVEGLLGGLTNLIEKLGALAEKGEELSRLRAEGDGEKGVNLVYGVSVRTVPGRPPWRVEPFGNVRRNAEGRPVVGDVREPLVDVFDEPEGWLLVAELPGVKEEDIHVRTEGETVALTANGGRWKYRKELRLAGRVRADGVTVSYRNGIAEIHCPRA